MKCCKGDRQRQGGDRHEAADLLSVCDQVRLLRHLSRDVKEARDWALCESGRGVCQAERTAVQRPWGGLHEQDGRSRSRSRIVADGGGRGRTYGPFVPLLTLGNNLRVTRSHARGLSRAMM